MILCKICVCALGAVEASFCGRECCFSGGGIGVWVGHFGCAAMVGCDGCVDDGEEGRGCGGEKDVTERGQGKVSDGEMLGRWGVVCRMVDYP